MQPAILNGSTFSGPAALSSLTGVGTKEICQAIRMNYGNLRIKAIHRPQIAWFLKLCGFRFDHIAYDRSYKKDSTGMWQPVKGPTLEKWIKQHQLKDICYLINVSEHYVVVLNDQIWDTQFEDGVGHSDDCRYLRCHVNELWTVQGEADLTTLHAMVGKKKASPGKPPVTVTLNWYKKKYNLQVIFNSDDCIVNWPNYIVQVLFAGENPFCQNNCFSSPADAVAAIEEVLTKYNLEKKPSKNS